jgi:hypothetical protein
MSVVKMSRPVRKQCGLEVLDLDVDLLRLKFAAYKESSEHRNGFLFELQQYYLGEGRFFQAITRNVKGIIITPVAIKIGSIIDGFNALPIAMKYGNGYTPAVKNQNPTKSRIKRRLRLMNLDAGFFNLPHFRHLLLSCTKQEEHTVLSQ